MKSLIKNTSLFLLFISLSTGCSDLLDTEPKQSVSLEAGLKDPGALRAVLTDNYNRFQAAALYGSGLVVLPEVMADNFEFNAKRNTYQANFLNSHGSHMNVWGTAYRIGKQAGAIIVNQDVIPENIRSEVVGQAYAQRALAYFSLMNVYSYIPSAIYDDQNRGGVPLIREPELFLADITYPDRASIDAVYDFIFEDLNQAIALLTNDPNDVSYFTQGGAQALASRVALYAGNYEDVITYADQALAAASELGVSLTDRTKYLDEWTSSKHSEAFFYIAFNELESSGQQSPQNVYTSEFSVNGIESYSGIGDGEYTPAVEILDYLAANPDDIRNSVLRAVELETSRLEVGTLELIKFSGSGGTNFSDDVPVVRISEVYLNKAEALAKLNRDGEAQDVLEIVKKRSLGDTYTASNTGQALIDEILFERRLELLGEGHRFFDLKRNRLSIDKTKLDTGTDEVIPFEDYRILAPLPSDELDINTNLINNFGY